MEVVQYSEGNISTCGENISTVGDNISTVEGIQYCGGIPSVLREDNSSTCKGIASVLGRLFSTVRVTSVHVGDNISTVGDNISTVEGIEYCEGIPSVLRGDNSSTYERIASVLWGIPSVLWRLFSTVGR